MKALTNSSMWAVFASMTVALALSAVPVHAQTPGQIPMFDPLGTNGACNSAVGIECVDSAMAQDASGNINIGTNLNLNNSTANAGNILKGGVPFIHNFPDPSNTFVGSNAGNFTMTGIANTATGQATLQSDTTGASNTANGVNALFSNTTGSFNTATGADALRSNTTGFANTAVGSGALRDNTGNSFSSAFGFAALESTTGSFNNAFGSETLRSNSTGTLNDAFGGSALRSNTTGSQNNAFGDRALNNNMTGNNNSAFGHNALFSNMASGNVAFGSLALSTNTTGDNNTAMGFTANVSGGNLSNATAIGANAIVNASNKIRLGDNNVTVVEGAPYSTVSDQTKKENFQPVDREEVLKKIGGLSLTSWNYIGHDPKQFRHYGPMGQDFFAAFGHDGLGTIGTPTTIAYTDMHGVLMIGMQALEKRTAELREEKERLQESVEAMKAENADLKSRLEQLEGMVRNMAHRTAWSESKE